MRRKLVVWDWPTRLFHWAAVVLVAAAYATWRLNRMDWHAIIGEVLLGFVLFRLLWGFFGSDTARFSYFLRAPIVGLAHLRRALRREPDRQVGHNPAGGWMVLLLVGLMLGETLSGLYVLNDVADQGPITPFMPAPGANLITVLHRLFWDALLAAVCLHVLAIALYAAIKGQNLVLPMLTGKKVLPEGVRAPRLASGARALLLMLLAALATAALVRYA